MSNHGIWAEVPIRDVVTVAADGFAVTVAEAKANSRVDGSIEDSVFERLIAAVSDVAKQILGGKALLTETRAYYLSGFPCARVIYIPTAPLRSITSIQYVDVNGVTQTLASGQYQVDTVCSPGRVLLHPDYSWPSTQCGILNAVTITYTCGYGAAADVPASIKDAILSAVTYKFEHRGDDEARSKENVEALLAEMLGPQTMWVA